MIYILIDTSYWIFYRYFALIQWWNHAKSDTPLGENPYNNDEFREKFIKTFIDSINQYKKKLKIKTECKIICARDCPRKEIWRNSLFDSYKISRDKDDVFMGGEFFKMVYDNDNKMLKDAGVEFVFKYNTLEADDIISILVKQIKEKNEYEKIIILANDHDYLQLIDEKIDIINFQIKNLKDSKKAFLEADKNLFFKIVLGDKSDDIPCIFKKCGPKTCQKYYENREEFEMALKKEDAFNKYEKNKKLVDFREIPNNLVQAFLIENQDFISKI